MATLLKVSFLIVFGLLSLSSQAQRFWLLTYEFTGGAKMGITSIRDSVLLVATHQGVMRSFNQGQSWETTLQTQEAAIFSIASHPSGIVLAGGNGKVFHSLDYGQTWDSTENLGNFPFAKIAFSPTGNALAATYNVESNWPEGTGVWFWNRASRQWSQRNNGLGSNWAIDQLAIASDGRAFVTVFDELGVHGGLYMSTNEGLQWTKVPVQFNGRQVVENQCQIQYATGLSTSGDSLYLSFYGKAGLAGVRLNLRKSLQELNQPTPWQQVRLGTGPTFWMDKLLNGIHFAQNGDRYSSHSGSLEQGGTYFYKANEWKRTVQGLGDDLIGRFGVQHFTELASGKVFMVQYLDERIYWADTSRRTVTQVPEVSTPTRDWQVYPNPVSCGEIRLNGAFSGSIGLTLRNLHGKIVKHFPNALPDATFDIGPLPKGLYLLEVNGKPLSNKLIVN